MRIGIDARFYSEAGIGRYIRNLISNLAKLDHENEYFIFLLDKNFDEVELPENFQKVRANFGWYGFSEQIKFPKLLNSYNLDLMHFPHFNVPVFLGLLPASFAYKDGVFASFAYKGKFVVTIHDLIHQNFQMKRATTRNLLTYKMKQFGYTWVFKTAIKNSENILVPSEYVKKLLINEWKVKEQKITVTPEAVDDKILSNETSLPNYEYIFYVGNAHPHKNVEGLIKAFLIIKKDFKNLHLVLAGHDHYFWQKVKKEYKDEGIVYKGYVTDKELVGLYKGAKAFVMPSLEEGFGIPILEAFATGTPVVASNVASLPEVGGDACIYFDPKNPTDIAEKTVKVLNDKNLRERLIKKGLQRYKLFSWEKLAELTLKVYEESV